MPNGGHRVRFIPEINLGHLVSAAVMLISATGVWFSMDARVAFLEREIKEIRTREVEIVRDGKEGGTSIETRLMGRINEEKARSDSVQAQTAYEIRDLKQIIRDGFRDLDAKLDRKQDKPGR